jgi:hypothetical protein
MNRSCLLVAAPLIVITACEHSPTSPSPRFVAGPGGNFATISDALKLAEPGDTIQVQPGTYGECVVVTVSSLKLHGDLFDGSLGGNIWQRNKGRANF